MELTKTKVGVLDVIWYALPLRKRLERIAELGFEATELWLGTRELGFRVDREWPETHDVKRVSMTGKELAEFAADKELKIHSFGQYNILGELIGPFPTEVATGEKRKNLIADMKSLMDYCAEAGVEILIAESGGDPAKPEQWPQLLESTRELVSHAEDVGVILAIENSPNCLVDDYNDLRRLMREVESSALRVNFDPANLALTPPGKWDFSESIRELGRYIVSLHAKDAVYGGGPYGKGPDGNWIMKQIGQGAVDWRECIQTLKNVGFNGYLIMEYSYPFGDITIEDQENGVLGGKRYLHKLLDS